MIHEDNLIQGYTVDRMTRTYTISRTGSSSSSSKKSLRNTPFEVLYDSVLLFWGWFYKPGAGMLDEALGLCIARKWTQISYVKL